MATEEFYERPDIVKKYDSVRFSGKGGHYINEKELNAAISLSGNLTNKSVLEIGPGTGRLTERILKKTQKLTLFDNSNEMLKVLKKKFKGKKIKYLQGDVCDLKLKDYCDLHISLRLFIHLNNDELERALKSASKAIKKNGHLVFDTLNSRSLYPMIKPISLLKSKHPYNHFISEKKMARMIRNAGFEIVGVKRIFVIPKFMIRYAPFLAGFLISLNNLLEKRANILSTHIFWKVKKI